MRQRHVPTSVVAAVVGDTCAFCENGTLERDTYRGNDAAVCSTCGTPAVQRF